MTVCGFDDYFDALFDAAGFRFSLCETTKVSRGNRPFLIKLFNFKRKYFSHLQNPMESRLPLAPARPVTTDTNERNLWSDGIS